MKTVNKEPIRFSVVVELRFLGIQTRWIAREERGERYFVPLVNQKLERHNECITAPDDIRRQFFRMQDDEESALEFLDSVGVWSAEENTDIWEWSDGTLRKGNTAWSVVVGPKDSRLVGAFGHRYFKGRALPMNLQALLRERKRWRDRMHNPAKLRKLFWPLLGQSVEERYIFALNSQFRNTLPIHLEWQLGHARAVIQPITCEELLKALAWIDLVTGAKVKICKKCKTEYTRGGTKYCSVQCERANTMHTYRENRKKKNASQLRALRLHRRALPRKRG